MLIVSQNATEQEWIGTAGARPGRQVSPTMGVLLYTNIRATCRRSLLKILMNVNVDARLY